MHPTGHEIELKLQLPDEAALEAVARAAGGVRAQAVRQINHFFDAASRPLRAHSFGLRLRDEEGRYFLTAKGPKTSPGQGALALRQEEEVEIPRARAEAILAGVEDPLDVLFRAVRPEGQKLLAAMLSALGRQPLGYLGAFENQRTRIDTVLPCASGPQPVLLELDRTTYPGGIVHVEIELELDTEEAAAQALPALEALLARAGTTGRPASGKASRFFRFLDAANASSTR